MPSGLYCGPNWSEGEEQESVCGIAPASSYLDQACKEHDCAYEQATVQGDLNQADRTFENKALVSGDLYGIYASLSVKLQRLVRMATKSNEAEVKRELRKVRKEAEKAKKEMKKEKRQQSMLQKGQKQSLKKEYAVPSTIGSTGSQRAYQRTLRTGKDHVEEGLEYIGVVSVATTNQIGDTLLTFNVTPESLASSRLGLLAQLYEKYEFLECSFEYTPGCSTQTSGQIVLFVDADPDDVAYSGSAMVKRAMSTEGSSGLVSPYMPSKCFMRSPRKQVFYTNNVNDNRFSVSGILYVISNSGAWGSNLSLGTVQMRYKIRLYQPTLEIQVAAQTGTQIMYNTSANPSQPFGGTSGALTMLSGSDIGMTWISGTEVQIAPGGYWNIDFWNQAALTTTLTTLTATVSTGVTLLTGSTGWAAGSGNFFFRCAVYAPTDNWTLTLTPVGGSGNYTGEFRMCSAHVGFQLKKQIQLQLKNEKEKETSHQEQRILELESQLTKLLMLFDEEKPRNREGYFAGTGLVIPPARK